MRLGAIDLGTNSCRMLIVAYKDGEIKEYKRDLKITRLGEGVDQNKALTDIAIRRALLAITSFVKKMKDLNVKFISINGTSALRDVNNADKLVEAVKEKTGLVLKIISGIEEARLNYIGVGNEYNGNLIIDIGGGSTEFIWQNEDKEINFKSLDIGSVRMTERYINDSSKKVSNEELLNIEKEVGEIINKNIINKIGKINKIIGLGGTITTIAAIDQKIEEYDTNKIQGYLLEINSIKGIFGRLRKMTIEERKGVKGLQAGREDIIIAGIKILSVIMNNLGLKNLMVSEQDLLYGAIKELIKEHYI